jgi:hypothetical protein
MEDYPTHTYHTEFECPACSATWSDDSEWSLPPDHLDGGGAFEFYSCPACLHEGVILTCSERL